MKTAEAVAAAVLALLPAFVFAQGVAESARANVSCPDAECHLAPFFRGDGGFVGQLDPDVMVDGEPLAGVTFVVTCDSVNITATVEPDADGRVAHLFTEDNGLACHGDDGEIQIHGLMDGAWYWIHDETNSAVEHLMPKDVLANMTTPPVDVSGGDITMTEGAGGHATLVKDTASGRVGILPHILPVPPPAPVAETPKCGGADNLRKGCVLTGEYRVDITRRDDGTPVNGTTIERGTADIDLVMTIGRTGTIAINSGTDVTADFVVSGPDGTGLPDDYGQGTAPDEDSIVVTILAAVDEQGEILSWVNASDNDPCRSSNQHRDKPVTVVVTLENSANTIPGFTAEDGPTASYSVSCPPIR